MYLHSKRFTTLHNSSRPKSLAGYNANSVPEFSLFLVEGVRSCLAGGGLLVCLVAGGLLFCLLSDFSSSVALKAGGDGVSVSMICWCFCFVLCPSLPGGACEVLFVRVLVRRVLAGTLVGGDGVSLSLGAMVCWCFCFVLCLSLPGGVFFVRVSVRRVLALLLVWPAS